MRWDNALFYQVVGKAVKADQALVKGGRHEPAVLFVFDEGFQILGPDLIKTGFAKPCDKP